MLDENYMDLVRRSLFNKANNEKQKSISKHSKRVSFEEAKSEPQNTDKSKKIKKRQVTPFTLKRKKVRKEISSVSDKSFEEEPRECLLSPSTSEQIGYEIISEQRTPTKAHKRVRREEYTSSKSIAGQNIKNEKKKLNKNKKNIQMNTNTGPRKKKVKKQVLTQTKTKKERIVENCLESITDSNEDWFMEDFNLDMFFNKYELFSNEVINTEPLNSVRTEFDIAFSDIIEDTVFSDNSETRQNERRMDLKVNSKNTKKNSKEFKTTEKKSNSCKKEPEKKLMFDLLNGGNRTNRNETENIFSNGTIDLSNGASNSDIETSHIETRKDLKVNSKNKKNYSKEFKATEEKSNLHKKKPEETPMFNLLNGSNRNESENIFSNGAVESSNSTSNSDYLEESEIIATLEENNESQHTTDTVGMNYFSETMSTNEAFCNAEYFDLTDGKLIILKANTQIYIHGLMKIKVLYGQLEVLGHILHSKSREIDFYSPRGSSLLYLRNPVCFDKSNEQQIFKFLPQLKDKDSQLNNVFCQENCTIVLCKTLESSIITFLEKHISQQIFPETYISKLPRAMFEPSGNWNKLIVNERWENVLQKITSSSKMMLAGGKGVGKSTFLRYAINMLLMRFPKIRVIDLDPGQPEFTVPGCISIVTVEEPVFGPNYTHLRTADQSLLSHINVANDPQIYMESLESLINFYNELEPIPTIVNCMGFVQGLGFDILSASIMYVQPHILVQITSASTKKNPKNDLNIENVKEHCKFFTGKPEELTYELVNLESMTDKNDCWMLEPRQMREMCVLAYFGKMMNCGSCCMTSPELKMLEIDFSSFTLTNMEGKTLLPFAANANLVVLCSLEHSSVYRCHGWGIVRGIDLETETLVLLTPENIETLENVYYLVIGSVGLPPSVLMTTDGIEGEIPYVNEGDLVSFGQLTKRSYLPPKKK